MNRFLPLYQPPDLPLDLLAADRLDPGHGQAIAVESGLPIDDKARHQGVGAAASAAAGCVKGGVAYAVRVTASDGKNESAPVTTEPLVASGAQQ